MLRTRDAETAQPRHRAPVTGSREGTRARSRGRRPAVLTACVAGAVVLLGGGAALLGGEESRPSPTAGGPRPSAAASAVPSVAASRAAQAAPSAAATLLPRTAAEARRAVQELLAARTDAALALLRSTWEGDEQAALAAAQVVAASSSGLAEVVGAWSDPTTAARVRAGLDQQSAASRAYAGAVAAGDGTAADEARAQMGQVSRELGAVLDALTSGSIADYVPPQDAAQLRAYVDGLEAGDAAAAGEAAQWLRSRSAREGVALAVALAGAGPS